MLAGALAKEIGLPQRGRRLTRERTRLRVKRIACESPSCRPRTRTEVFWRAVPRGSVGCKREIAPTAVGSGVCWECWRAAKVEGERAAKGSPGHGCARRELGHGAGLCTQ